MRFEDAYEGWTEKRLTQIDAAQLLSVYPRTFRRTINPSAGSGTTPRPALRVIPRVVAESRNPELKSFYRPFWMLRLRAA